MATVDELSAASRHKPDSERRASRIAARRAIRDAMGSNVAIELRRRAGRAPRVRVRTADGVVCPISLSLTHRDGHAAAIAARGGTRVGIDLERLDAIEPCRRRVFLTEREERVSAGRATAVLWALKEAAWKALRLGGNLPFTLLELDIDDELTVRGVRCGGVHYTAVAAVTCPWPEYVLATVELEPGK